MSGQGSCWCVITNTFFLWFWDILFANYFLKDEASIVSMAFSLIRFGIEQKQRIATFSSGRQISNLHFLSQSRHENNSFFLLKQGNRMCHVCLHTAFHSISKNLKQSSVWGTNQTYLWSSGPFLSLETSVLSLSLFKPLKLLPYVHCHCWEIRVIWPVVLEGIIFQHAGVRKGANMFWHQRGNGLPPSYFAVIEGFGPRCAGRH